MTLGKYEFECDKCEEQCSNDNTRSCRRCQRTFCEWCLKGETYDSDDDDSDCERELKCCSICEDSMKAQKKADKLRKKLIKSLMKEYKVKEKMLNTFFKKYDELIREAGIQYPESESDSDDEAVEI